MQNNQTGQASEDLPQTGAGAPINEQSQQGTQKQGHTEGAASQTGSESEPSKT